MASRFQYIAQTGLLFVDNEVVFNMRQVFSLYHSGYDIWITHPSPSEKWGAISAQQSRIRASSAEFQELLEKLKKHD